MLAEHGQRRDDHCQRQRPPEAAGEGREFGVLVIVEG
jgi:hypothetical protein